METHTDQVFSITTDNTYTKALVTALAIFGFWFEFTPLPAGQARITVKAEETPIHILTRANRAPVLSTQSHSRTFDHLPAL